MNESTGSAYIECKLIDAGETVTARSLAYELGIPFPVLVNAYRILYNPRRIIITSFIISPAYLKGKISVHIKPFSEYCEDQLVEAVSVQYRLEDLVECDLERLLGRFSDTS